MPPVYQATDCHRSNRLKNATGLTGYRMPPFRTHQINLRTSNNTKSYIILWLRIDNYRCFTTIW